MKKSLCVVLALFFMLGIAGTCFADGTDMTGTDGPEITAPVTDGMIPVIPPGPPPKK